MARLPRYSLPGQPQHVIQRGNNRTALFADEPDYRFFIECLAEACVRHECRVHAYVLMTNHVHLLMTPDREDAIGKVMQSVGRRYVQYFNYTYQRTGKRWTPTLGQPSAFLRWFIRMTSHQAASANVLAR